MAVSALSRHADETAFRHARRASSLDALLAKSDILSLHAALNDETREMIDARALALLPKGALIVNTARGGLIDEAALMAALDSGQIAGRGAGRDGDRAARGGSSLPPASFSCADAPYRGRHRGLHGADGAGCRRMRGRGADRGRRAARPHRRRPLLIFPLGRLSRRGHET